MGYEINCMFRECLITTIMSGVCVCVCVCVRARARVCVIVCVSNANVYENSV